MSDLFQDIRTDYINQSGSFQFCCHNCGNCCNYEVEISPHDLFRIAKHLNKTLEEVLDTYCELTAPYGVPIPVLKRQPACIFYTPDGCSIYDAKPDICSLYPIHRQYTAVDDTIKFYPAPNKCGKEKLVKVKNWFQKFGIPLKDEAFMSWNDACRFLEDRYAEKSQFVSEISMNFNKYACFARMYLQYDLDQDFLPQFKESVACIMEAYK